MTNGFKKYSIFRHKIKSYFLTMKQFVVLLLLLVQYTVQAQVALYEKPPVFSNCDSLDIQALKSCFDKNVMEHIFNTFNVPQNVKDSNYKGDVVVLFEVDTTGQFRVMYVDAMFKN
jgi:hypothetical protein